MDSLIARFKNKKVWIPLVVIFSLVCLCLVAAIFAPDKDEQTAGVSTSKEPAEQAAAPAEPATPYPTYTLYPTYTPYPTLEPVIIVVTATGSPTPLYTPTITETPGPTATFTSTPDLTTEDRSDGFYLVNAEIAPGVWKSDGTGDMCYWETTTKTGDIIGNHFGMAGGTAYIAPQAFQVKFERCGTWTYMGQ